MAWVNATDSQRKSIDVLAILLTHKCGERRSLVATTEIVKADKHWVSRTIFNLVKNDDTSPVGVALFAFVAFLVQIRSATNEAELLLSRSRQESYGVVKGLLMAHNE